MSIVDVRPPVARADQWLEQELELQRLCTSVAIELALLVEEHLPAAGELMAAVAADIVARWNAERPAGSQRAQLFGPDGYVAWYVRTVENDRHGHLRPEFRGPERIIDGAPAEGIDLKARVWAQHAGWLLRIATPLPDAEQLAGAAPPAERERITRLGRELEAELLRTRAAAALAPLVWQALGRDRQQVTAVAAAVVAAWQARGPDGPTRLTGQHGFVDSYYGQVCYQRTAESDEDFWPAFLPASHRPGDVVDEQAYERAVWTHHAAHLVAVR